MVGISGTLPQDSFMPKLYRIGITYGGKRLRRQYYFGKRIMLWLIQGFYAKNRDKLIYAKWRFDQ